MFDPLAQSRVFSLPIGCDFSKAFVDGLCQRMSQHPPQEMARIEVYVNTRRTMRRMQELFQQKGAMLLPQFRLITELSNDPLALCKLPEPAPSIRRVLQLGQLVRAVLNQDSTIASASMTFDLANSLSALLDEVQGEGVLMKQVLDLDVSNHSEHWDRSKRFLSIIADHWDQNSLTDPQDRMRHVVQAYSQYWHDNPPTHPIIIAGSTGSRGETAQFMKTVSNLPQGCVVLPGLDAADPSEVWDSFNNEHATLDHPQAGFAKLLRTLEISRGDVVPWMDTKPYSPARNQLVSLSLRPAPITDQWLQDGPKIASKISDATQGLSLIEAQNQKEEALAIATCLRQAAQNKTHAVLITPNRALTRRVSANLNRWAIEADDSAGLPLNLSPPGIFLRLIASSFGRPLTPQKLVTLLKHTLTHSNESRSQHNLFAQRLEIKHLRGGAPEIDFTNFGSWLEKQPDQAEATIWVSWIKDTLAQLQDKQEMALGEWIQLHIQTAEQFAAGSNTAGSGELWEKSAGAAAQKTLADLLDEHIHGGLLTALEYNSLISTVLNQEVREDVQTAHPYISIWGTLEARVQGADLVILGGLNEGTWPEKSSPDMWMNRDMRAQLGLLLPDRIIGLSAHDFQQAMGAPNVVLSRSLRDGDALSNASRWVIRLTNLLSGLGDQGKTALMDMRARGNEFIAFADYLDQPENVISASTRPAPIPPKGIGIRKLSVTQIQRLIRNPYEIYAREILRLRKIKPLGKEADVMERGIAIHDVIEEFTNALPAELPPNAKDTFLDIAQEVLAKTVPWPSAQRLWLARLTQSADRFLQGEAQRRSEGEILAIERQGNLHLKDLDFTLTVKADRIDQGPNGLRIYDYKSGNTPTKNVMKLFDKQLQLEALIAAHGGFDKIDAAMTEHLEYVGVTASKDADPIEIGADFIATISAELHQLIAHFNSGENGFTAHDKEQMSLHTSDYDHLSRKGEWEISDAPDPKGVS